SAHGLPNFQYSRSWLPGQVLERVARSRGGVGQPDYILSDQIIGDQAEARTRADKVWLAAAEDDWMQVDSILIDQAGIGQNSYQVGSGNGNQPCLPGFQFANRGIDL